MRKYAAVGLYLGSVRESLLPWALTVLGLGTLRLLKRWSLKRVIYCSSISSVGLTVLMHFIGMSEVIGLKVVDAYFMQFGGDGTRDSGVARFVDIVCPQVPTCAQLLTTRGHVLARCPLERATATNDDVTFDKQAKLMTRKTNYFNPISIKKLDFSSLLLFT